jgi:putative MATE family efflux protein
MEKIKRLFQGMLDERDFYHLMLKIALPIMIQNFISSFLNMIDTVMVGKLGETQIAAVGIANQYFFFFNMFLLGMCAGCAVFISQFWGKGEIRNIKRIMGIGLFSAVLISAVFMAVGFAFPGRIMAAFNHDPKVIELGSGYLRMIVASYLFTGITFVFNFSLRSIGKTVQPMLISALALLCDIFLNYVFIFGQFGVPAMGVVGSALATLIARIVETTILVAYIYGSRNVLAASVRELTDVSWEFVKKSYRVILPVILNDTCWGLASLVYAAVYGRMGTPAVAAIQICTTVNNLFLVAIFGLSSAAAVMVGNSIGAGKEELSKQYARSFSTLGVALGFLLGILLAVASPAVLSIFNVSDTVRRGSQIILYIISAIFFIRVFDIILIVGILRGGGDAKRAFLIEGFTMWFIGVPLTILGAFVFKLPVYDVYALAIMEEVSKCVLGLIRLRSGRWIRNVTQI